MSKLTIYQKPTCSTCRTVMTRLNEAGIDYDAINYIIEPPSRQKLAELARKMHASPRELLRTKEPEYRQLNLDDPSLGDDKILDAMAEHPSLIQRPILEYGDRAAMARPAERIDEIVKELGIGREQREG
jgi:arsenate reductase (glutaredoxin)